MLTDSVIIITHSSLFSCVGGESVQEDNFTNSRGVKFLVSQNCVYPFPETAIPAVFPESRLGLSNIK